VSAPRLVVYDPRWPDLCADEARRISDALGYLAHGIEHVGSTSVPGLAAKPTIDIAVGVADIALPAFVVHAMEALGYQDVGRESRPGERRFRKGERMPWDFIVHVVEWHGDEWTSYVRFRDQLRADPATATAYAALKHDLLNDLGEWYRGTHKQDFILSVLRRHP
jgi:GrpB-like predicted nucleotidyltransferase (UPF0157 family)